MPARCDAPGTARLHCTAVMTWRGMMITSIWNGP